MKSGEIKHKHQFSKKKVDKIQTDTRSPLNNKQKKFFFRSFFEFENL
jgi:hypothetical protein